MPTYSVDWRFMCLTTTEQKALRIAKAALHKMGVDNCSIAVHEDIDIPGHEVLIRKYDIVANSWNDAFVQLLATLGKIAKELAIDDINNLSSVSVTGKHNLVAGITLVEATIEK